MKRPPLHRRRLSVETLEDRRVFAGISFSNASSAAGVAGADGNYFNIAWVDYNSDGWQDLYLGPHGEISLQLTGSGEQQNNPTPKLFRNNQNGTFTEVFASVFPDYLPGDRHGTLWIDVDNDNDLDFFQAIGAIKGMARDTDIYTQRLYVQEDGQLQLAPDSSGLNNVLARGREIEAFDANADGMLDFFFSNTLRPDRLAPSGLFLSSAQGYRRVNSSPAFDLTETEILVSQANDVTGDGRADLVSLLADGRLQINTFRQEPGKFIPATPLNLLPASPSQGFIRDFAVADFTGDGWNDIVVVRNDTGGQRLELLAFDKATGKFVDRSGAAGIAGIQRGTSVTHGDYDNDQDVDIFLSVENGTVDNKDLVLTNNGQGVFTSTPMETAVGKVFIDHGLGRKAITADYNNDGFLDVYLNSSSATGSAPLLHRNAGNANHWIEIDLEGVVSSREAIGAKVEVIAGGVKQVDFQTTGKHHFAQDSQRLHFGLGANTTIDSIRVTWPSGLVTERTNVEVDKILKLYETSNSEPLTARPIPLQLNAGNLQVTLDDNHPEGYFQFTIERPGNLQLLPVPEGTLLSLTAADATTVVAATPNSQGENAGLNVNLTAGKYYLHFERTNSTVTASYELEPQWLETDTAGPLVDQIILDVAQHPRELTVRSIVSDVLRGNSRVTAAKFWIDQLTNVATTGYTMTPEIGATFDSSLELVSGRIPQVVYDALSVGEHTIYVRAKDEGERWGVSRAFKFFKQTSTAPQFSNVPARVNEVVGAATRLFWQASVTDADTAQFPGAELTIHLNTVFKGESLSLAYDNSLKVSDRLNYGEVITFQGREIASVTGGTVEWLPGGARLLFPLRIQFNGRATVSDVTAVLRRVVYNNTGTIRPLPDRLVEAYFHDGKGGRAAAALQLRSSLFTQIPYIQLQGSATYNASGPPISIGTFASYRDSNATSLAGSQLLVTMLANAESNDRLTIATGTGFEVVQNQLLYQGNVIANIFGGRPDSALKINFTAAASTDLVKPLLLSLRFSSSGITSSLARRLQVQFTDSNALVSNLVQIDVAVQL
jgi:ASPIC and UnbV/FG-GAP-like repeat